MADMMDDLRVFKLRLKDTGRKVHLLTYRDISQLYSFICFDENIRFPAKQRRTPSAGNNIPFDFLDDIYHRQRTNYGDSNVRVRYDKRNDYEIDVCLTSAQKDWLKKSVAEKEETEKYLCDKYDELLKKHKKITLLPFAFYLPDDWVEEHENNNSMKFSLNAIEVSLEELKRRFDKMIKTLKSRSEYDPACAYTRLIFIDEKFRPFYLVNFFFHGDDINNFFAEDIWSEWLNTRDSKNKENERAVLYAFDSEHKPCRDAVKGLYFSRPDEGVISKYDTSDIVDYIINLNITQPNLIKNNRKAHEDFFRIQAQRYNSIPDSRAKTFSDNFTYTPSTKKKTKGKSD
ncbi:hypothetical protein [Pectobacterium punjabense]|uniref:hypothetical protein n=1 Tax=Pectobacterium punjabense TaxID=2108399 RepID=UPI00381BE10A